jgi:hypothetical protein
LGGKKSMLTLQEDVNFNLKGIEYKANLEDIFESDND